jgi:type II secretion system protein C
MKSVQWLVDHHRKVINWIGVFAVAWIGSMIAGEIIGSFLPQPSYASAPVSDGESFALSDMQRKSIAYYMPICERNLFDSQKRAPCTKQVAAIKPTQNYTPPTDPDAAPVLSSINAKLKGTTVFGDPKRSFATLSESGSRETVNYKIEDKILGKARIYQIERNRIYFFNAGRREYLEIERPSVYSGTSTSSTPSRRRSPSAKGITIDGNNITVTRAKVDETMANMNKVLQDARMVPNYNNGVVDGFKVFGIKSDSIFQQLGLKNGDVINQINGTTVDGLEKALPMLQLLKTQDNFEIGITRRGSKQNLKINVQ